jgi:hypothetical protein
MAEAKYLITVNSETGIPTKLEKLGEDGELTPVDLSKISFDSGNLGGASVVINIYSGGATVAPKGFVKVTDGDDFCIRFPCEPPGRKRT